MPSSEREVVFQSNPQAGAMFAAMLMRGVETVLKDVEKVLKGWGEEYKRRVTRVTPRDTGAASQRWAMEFERDAKSMSVTVSNPQQYLVHLEYGTDRIAKGKVKEWKEGDPPIMSWPAKSADLPEMPKFGTKKYERYETILTNAFTAGRGEQMPMLRPIGHDIAPKVLEDVGQAVVEGFKAVVAKRKGS